MNRPSRHASLALGALLLAACQTTGPTTESGTSAVAGPVEWRMQSAWGSNIPVIGEAATRLPEELTRRSAGELRVEFFEPGAVVPAIETHEAVARGTLDAGFTTAGYAVGNNPAMVFFSGVPFGAGGLDQYRWVKDGSGRALHDELHAQLGLKAIPCGYVGAEGGGWFREPIESVEDLDGLKMRYFGLGARVMQRLGVSTQLLAGGDIYPALERGVIGATEFSTPYIDLAYGLYRVAPHYYYPGWHQLASLTDLVINLDRWNALSTDLQSMIEETCDDNVRWAYERDESLTRDALAKLRRIDGVTVEPYPKDVVLAAHRAWEEIADEDARRSRDFSRVLDAYRAFLVDNPSPALD